MRKDNSSYKYTRISSKKDYFFMILVILFINSSETSENKYRPTSVNSEIKRKWVPEQKINNEADFKKRYMFLAKIKEKL